jgi:ribose transport system permease protein
LSDNIGISDGSVGADSPRRIATRTLMSNALFGTRFATIWIAAGLLAIVCAIVAHSTFTSASWSSMLPFGSLVAILALGQMLVIMVGGIDLSMAASISLLANILVGVSKGANGRLGVAVLTVLCVAVLIGLVNGLLVAIV